MVALAGEFGQSDAVWRAPSDCSVRHNGARRRAVHSSPGVTGRARCGTAIENVLSRTPRSWSAFARSAAR